MNLVIVSWNIQGQFSIGQLIDRMIENGWDLLIVLEPQRAMSGEASHKDIGIKKVDVGDQFIIVMWYVKVILKCNASSQSILVGERAAAVIEIASVFGASYRILTAHAPYKKNDGTAAQFQQSALKWAEKKSIDLVVGDLNTYGSKVGSSSRSHFMNLSEGLGTSRGGSQLDKALLSNSKYYGLPSDVNANMMNVEDIELPESSYVQSGSRASMRPSTARSGLGRGKIPDHRPLIVKLPAGKLLSSTVFLPSTFQRNAGGPATIKDDGHCLYRCIAHVIYDDQDDYQTVREELAEHILVNWNNYPYLQHLQTLGQLHNQVQAVSTNLWGGELELAILAEIYDMRITVQSPQGYAQAVYGNGSIAVTIRHTGTHFEVL